MGLSTLLPSAAADDAGIPAEGGLAGVFAAHRAQLKRTAQQILGDTHHADDLVHDAYLKAVEADGGEPAAVRQPLAYAHQIVRHMAIDRHRPSGVVHRIFSLMTPHRVVRVQGRRRFSAVRI